jgi:hypothetical protein
VQNEKNGICFYEFGKIFGGLIKNDYICKDLLTI